MSQLEIVANAFNLVSVYLAKRNNVHTWWIGIIACTLFAFVFYRVKLYADVSLQVFFALTSIYGAYQWRYGGKAREELPISRLRPLVFMLFLGLAGICTATYGLALHYWTDASFPFIDSVVLMLSILGQLLLISRKLEAWLVWIAVNLVAAPLFYSKELYLTSVVYVLFLGLAVLGWFRWRRLWRAGRQ